MPLDDLARRRQHLSAHDNALEGSRPAMAPSKKLKETAGFEQEGPLEWAILAPVDARSLEEKVARLSRFHDIEPDESRSWCVLKGTKKYSAMIETAPGSTSMENELAAALSKGLGVSVFVVGFAGYGDPDQGLPFIQRYDGGTCGLVWMEAGDSDDDLKTVPGPKGIPADDPFDFTDALGCKLRRYSDRRGPKT